MEFTYKKQAEILDAIGSIEGTPMTLQRALAPGADFEPLPAPAGGDWLAEHPEPGQSFECFVRSYPKRPDARKNKMYLQPLGNFPEGLSPSVEALKVYSSAFFMMNVEVLDSLAIEGADIHGRRNPYTGNRQILTTDILALLKEGFPRDAFSALAITMEDLYPESSWNFVFGQASHQHRVGVFSFARYSPAFYREELDSHSQQTVLRRSCKVLAHETGHLFQMDHCVFFKCLMNGSNHLQESDARPLFLCPVCLRKLHHSIGFDVVERYRRLLSFYRDVDFTQEGEWVSGRLKAISSTE